MLCYKMKSLLILVAIIFLVECNDERDEIFEKLHKDPLNAFLVNDFKRRKTIADVDRSDRLPRDVVVHSYDILIEPFFDFYGFEYNKALKNTFNGATKISFSVLRATNQVVLASLVAINSMSLNDGRRRIAILKNETKLQSILVLHTAERLVPDKNYTLNFKYHKAWSAGVNFLAYRNPEGRDTALVATEFETTRARAAFPCFDDPFFKASFDVTLIHPKGAKAYSNGDIKEQRYFDEQRLRTTFKTSPKMSTYLVAFAIGDFVESNYTSKSGVLNRAIVIRNHQPFIKTSAKYGALCVDAMEGLVQVRLPLQKLDHLDSFGASSGAMENFGLIIYNNAVPEGFGYTVYENAYSRRVMCHETAHQWFGNLVTADHWGWEFLHESFATFFETKLLFNTEAGYLAQASEPARIKSAVETYANALHPIVDDKARFDRITYAVGGGLLLSVQHALGHDVFYAALRFFQVENKFGVAGLDTLIRSFVKAKGSDKLCGSLTIAEYLEDYFLRTGSPEVNITIQDGNYVLTQIPQERDRTWNVPIFVLDLTSNKEHILWLRKDGSVCSADNFQLHADGEYFFNNEGKGFAFYNIPREIWPKLAKSQRIYELSSLNLDILLSKLFGPFKPEQVARIVYDIIEKKKGKVEYFLVGYLARERELAKAAAQIVGDNFDYIPTPQNRLLGMAFLEEAVKFNISSVVEKTSEWFEQFKKDCAPDKDVAGCTEITPEWRRAVYRQGYRTKEGQDFIRNYAKRINSHKWKSWMRSEYDRTQSL